MPILTKKEKILISIFSLGLAYPVIWYIERENEKEEKERFIEQEIKNKKREMKRKKFNALVSQNIELKERITFLENELKKYQN